ncbi:MAG: hypothetical protein HQK52_19580 [Oligoflexia bacterium]|nr:hypothetical protein [Oligoflexia bacterium]
MKCILCRKDEANSAEHFYKKSILAEEFNNDLDLNLKLIDEISGKFRDVQGPDSKRVKYSKNICISCNGHLSKDADNFINSIVSCKTLPLTKMSSLVDAYGFPMFFKGQTRDIEDLCTQKTYKFLLRLDLISIYEYLKYKRIANFLCENESSKMNSNFKNMMKHLESQGSFLQDIPRIPFYGKIFNPLVKDEDFLNLIKYYSKQAICSLNETNIAIPVGLRAIFFKKIIPKNITAIAHVFAPLNTLPIMIMPNVFVDSKGKLVISIYQEFSKSHAFFICFTFEKISKRFRNNFKESFLRKKMFPGYVEKF